MNLYRVLTQVAFAAFLATIVIGFLNFGAAKKPTTGELAGNSGVVVFTGAYERIDASLELLADGATDRLFVSGANSKAGIRPKRFVGQFGPRHPKLREMLDCCIEFGPHAETTLQNALETRCWLERHEIAGSIVLVTSAEHMPRARTALRGFVSNRQLIPFPVPHEAKHSPEVLRRKMHEYIKYVVTSFLIQIPEVVLSSLGLYGDFENGCPGGDGSIPYTGGRRDRDDAGEHRSIHIGKDHQPAADSARWTPPETGAIGGFMIPWRERFAGG